MLGLLAQRRRYEENAVRELRPLIYVPGGDAGDVSTGVMPMRQRGSGDYGIELLTYTVTSGHPQHLGLGLTPHAGMSHGTYWRPYYSGGNWRGSCARATTTLSAADQIAANGQATFALWVRPVDIGDSNWRFQSARPFGGLRQGVGALFSRWMLGAAPYSNPMEFALQVDNYYNLGITGFGVNAVMGQWQFVGIRGNGAETTLLLNGEPVASVPVGIPGGTQAFSLGSPGETGNNSGNASNAGTWSDGMFFRRAISDDEFRFLYLAGLNGGGR